MTTGPGNILGSHPHFDGKPHGDDVWYDEEHDVWVRGERADLDAGSVSMAEEVPYQEPTENHDVPDDGQCLTIPLLAPPGVQEVLGYDPQRATYTITNVSAVPVSIGFNRGITYGGPNTVLLGAVGAANSIRVDIKNKRPLYAVAQAANAVVDVLVQRYRNA